MLSRRGFFGLIAGVLATPILEPIVRLIPEQSRFGLELKAYYDKRALANLKANTPFLAMLKKQSLPKFEGGKTIQFFTYDLKSSS